MTAHPVPGPAKGGEPVEPRLLEACRSRAVLIGSSRYEDAGLPQLPAVHHNLTRLGQLLTDVSLTGLQSTHCVTLENWTGAPEILESIDVAARRAGDTFLVYFTGHGCPAGGPGDDLLLCLPGTRLDERSRALTALPYRSLCEAVADSPARNKVIILDCCYSGKAFSLDAHQVQSLGGAQIEGTFILTSVGATESASAPEGAHYTSFTGVLVDLLENGIADGPELITLKDVYERTKQVLRDRGLPAPRTLGTDTVDSLALSRNPAYVADAGAPSRPVPDSLPDTVRRLLDSDEPIIRAEGVKLLGPLLDGDSPFTAQLAHAILRDMAGTDEPRVAQVARHLLDQREHRSRPVPDARPEPDDGPAPDVAPPDQGDPGSSIWRHAPRPVATLEGHDGWVECLAFDADANLLGSMASDGQARVWDVPARETLHVLPAGSSDTAGTLGLAFNPGERQVACLRDGFTIELWDPSTGQALRELTTSVSALRCLAFSVGGDCLAAGDDDGIVRIWDPATGEVIHRLDGGRTEVLAVGFSSMGPCATACADGAVRLWDPSTEALMDTWHRAGENARVLAFDPAGELLAVGDDGGRVHLWDVRNQRVLHTLHCRAGQLKNLAFSHDGAVLGVGGRDGKASVWDVGRGCHLYDLSQPSRRVDSLAMSETGGVIATGSSDGMIRLWQWADRGAAGAARTDPRRHVHT